MRQACLSSPGKNRLTVAVNNIVDYTTLPVGNYQEEDVPGMGKVVTDTPNFDFFNYAGIQRPVKLYTTPKTYIRDITMTTEVQGTNAQVGYTIETEGDAEIHVSIQDETGETVARGTGPTGQLAIKGVHLWQPLHAYDEALGIETPCIPVTLATGIPEERCRRINLGYADYREIDPDAWKGREQEGILFVPHAGEMLYRARGI